MGYRPLPKACLAFLHGDSDTALAPQLALGHFSSVNMMGHVVILLLYFTGTVTYRFGPQLSPWSKQANVPGQAVSIVAKKAKIVLVIWYRHALND